MGNQGPQLIAIEKLLNRIRWDEEFGKARFELGYCDHIEKKIIRVPFEHVHFEKGNHFSFELVDENGETITLPFHRVREVYKDGQLIWKRPESNAGNEVR